MGGGWEAEGRLKQPFRLKEQCCTFSLWHKLLQCTKEAKTGERSSLVPHAVLLMHPRAMKCTLMVSQHRQKAVCKSRPGYVSIVQYLVFLDSARVYPSCTGKTWISVLVHKWSVFQNTVTYGGLPL